MADYYSILGLSKNANEIEIKTAFRKLAKVYHPDKNPNDPNAKHLFEVILKAYNTLINPHSRKRYDTANFSDSVTKLQPKHSRQKGQKEWAVNDEDLKRRDYYKNHYNQIKKKAVRAQAANTTNRYTDYKYVLFATPIAVGLLMLILSIFSSKPKTELLPEKEVTSYETKLSVIDMSNGDKPYKGYFGTEKIFETKNNVKINNSSSMDAVIVVFQRGTNQYLQHTYLKDSYSADFSGLPDDGIYWKCVLGKNWNNTKLLLENKISGGFDSVAQYQNREALPIFFPQNGDEINLLYVIDPRSENKQYISNEAEFFKK
ncbi:MAG: J domain-containing protein [Bacteroidota bacterium]